MSNFLITGALGFIGSNFVNYYAKKYPDSKIIILDKLDYCASRDNITVGSCSDSNRSAVTVPVEIIIGNISSQDLVRHILYKEQIDTIIHFAAYSHVDNSFNNSLEFTENNVLGTHKLLEVAREYHQETKRLKQFIHVSTDEVYGEVIDGQIRTEKSVLDSTNPYAATKEGAEAIARSYFKSYKLPIIITRANNVYGINQYPEKIIPKFILQLNDGKPVTIHGTGENRRKFIHVDDVSTAYETIIQHGVVGEIYNISAPANSEYSVMEIAQMLINLMDKNPDTMIDYVADRNFNDLRYHTSSAKLEELGWKPVKTNFKENLIELINWYIKNRDRYSNI